MKKLCFFLACTLLVFSISTVACAAIVFKDTSVAEEFNASTKQFFEAIGMDTTTAKQCEDVCHLFGDFSTWKEHGLNAYQSVDNHILFVQEDFIFSYADLSDNSTLKNIPQMVLCFSLKSFLTQDGMEMLEWTQSDDTEKHFEGEEFDAYLIEKPRKSLCLLIVNHGQNIEELSFKIEKLQTIAEGLLD